MDSALYRAWVRLRCETNAPQRWNNTRGRGNVALCRFRNGPDSTLIGTMSPSMLCSAKQTAVKTPVASDAPSDWWKQAARVCYKLIQAQVAAKTGSLGISICCSWTKATLCFFFTVSMIRGRKMIRSGPNSHFIVASMFIECCKPNDFTIR